MIGVGRCVGAITIVNALFTGVGSAAAISIPAEATVSLRPTPSSSAPRWRIAGDSDSSLARTALATALRRFAGGRSMDAELSVSSAIPPACGLKSSSAVSNSILLAVARAIGREPAANEIAQLSAHVARASGESATGAFDDALASVAGGAWITDNRVDRALRALELDPEWAVSLWIPPGRHAPSIEWAGTFAHALTEGEHAVQLAERGEVLRAMERNSAIVERILGYDYAATRAACRRAGALACGVSGMGPTLAVISSRSNATKVRNALPRGRGDVVGVELVAAGAVPR